MDTMSIPSEIMAVISSFSTQFTRPTWENVKLLLIGAILCRGPRRVTSILRVMGLGHKPGFCKYHRLFSRAKWNSIKLSGILLTMLIALLPDGCPVIVVVDETLERRKGKRIKAKGYYRDALRSSNAVVVKCLGLKWECMMLIVPLPFCKRPWALPFMTILAASRQANEAAGIRHKTSNEWTIIMVRLVCRWLGKQRRWILVGDGAYACFDLAKACIKNEVTQISRLRLDAQLHEYPESSPVGKRGRKPQKGKRIRLGHYINDENQNWQSTEIVWYGEKSRSIKFLSKSCLWYQSGKGAVPLRYVLVVDPAGIHRTEVFYSTDTELAPESIIEYYVRRWNIEVTFEESREHLGFETQRQWSDRSIARTTPLLMGLYSLATLFALELRKTRGLTPSSTAWYNKNDNATFSDVMALVRRSIWSDRYLSKSSKSADIVEIRNTDLGALINQLVAA